LVNSDIGFGSATVHLLNWQKCLTGCRVPIRDIPHVGSSVAV
jgi:hypothetical protein